MSTPAVEFRSITKRFGGFTALEEMSLAIPAGAFFCLLGSSGSGKSTALRLIAGLESCTGGELLIDGRVVNTVPPHKRPVNTVFQSYALFPRMTLYDNVAYGLKAARVNKALIQERVEHALDMVHLAAQRNRRPAQLSGGQQQRGALARALVNEPLVLLLDEPLGALDLQLRREMQRELVSLHKRTGTTFVHVTHDQEEAFACATDIGVIDSGKLLQVGSPADLYRQPRNLFVAGFVGSANLVPATVVARDERGCVVDSPVGRGSAGSWDSLVPGARTVLVIRPEDIDVTDARESHDGDWIPGRLLSSSVGGSTTRLTVEVNGTVLTTEQPGSPSARLAASPGDPVAVRCNRETAWLVPPEAPDSSRDSPPQQEPGAREGTVLSS